MLAFLLAVFALCPWQLPAAIQQITSQPPMLRSRFGILVEYLDFQNSSWSTLYDGGGTAQLFTPASNNKVLTCAAAYLELGAEWRASTEFYLSPQGRELCVRAGGDPTITSSSFPLIVKQLVAAGVSESISSLVFDDSFFIGAPFPPTWCYQDLMQDYGAAPTSFICNENAISVTLVPNQVGAKPFVVFESTVDEQFVQYLNQVIVVDGGDTVNVTASYELGAVPIVLQGQFGIDSGNQTITFSVSNPREYFAAHLLNALNNAGFNSIKSVSYAPCEAAPAVLSFPSQPLYESMNYTLQMSDNLRAETFLRQLGALHPVPGNSTQEAGIARVSQLLGEMGVPPLSYVQTDGSGLSRETMVSPQAEIAVLQRMVNESLWRSFLPLAGETGTLQDRFRGTPAQGIVQAKTGTLGGVSALSGYLTHPQFNQIVFSIILNDSYNSEVIRETAIDDIVILLAILEEC
jgi:D-alanyl-D-alanine carboxypeptidase/D-alanyl-D-alanine-endopeptidase (penicillin-binding protein 4)